MLIREILDGLNVRYQISEGIHDPVQRKAIIVMGGPGSGKTNLVRKLGLTAMGFIDITSDKFYELYLSRVGLNHAPEQRERAKALAKAKLWQTMDNGVGIVYQTTGQDVKGLIELKQKLEQSGYSILPIYVNTSIDIARNRNAARTKRKVPSSDFEQIWDNVKSSVEQHKQIFPNLLTIDRGAVTPEDKAIEQEKELRLYRMIRKWAT